MGKDVGLVVSDAGTPGISDPGYSAVAEVRKHFALKSFSEGEGFRVGIITIPGASALTAFVYLY
jgi:16S rRNA C1402 (ribose-2'-O) methylase RsmI